MALSAADFAAAPAGAPVPSALELHALAIRGSGFTPNDRVKLMNTIGSLIGIPNGGWAGGQSRLIEHGDVRLVWLLRRLARQESAKTVAQSIGHAARFMASDLMLTMVTAARENASSLEAVSMRPINSWEEGGLDFLWKEKDKLRLPASVTANWVPVKPFISGETKRLVYPAKFPARDQVLVYAAQLNASFVNNLDRHLREVSQARSGKPAEVWSGSRLATLVWKAYAFLAPGGPPYDGNRSFAQQAGQKFGSHPALTYLAQSSGTVSVPAGQRLDIILASAELNSLEWLRIAKARCAEALFSERLWKTTRELLPI